MENNGKYINPYTDYGFKYFFGTEPNKDLTLNFVNALLQGREVIKSLTLLPTEQLGDTEEDRKSVFDVYCENEKGDKIIIEMQKADQQWFKDRSVYYSSFPIRSQGEKGKWLFGLKAVYTIGILNFVFDEDKDDENYYHHVVQLMDVNKKTVFYDKLTYIYLEMPKFRKTEDELVTMDDKQGAFMTADSKGYTRGVIEGRAKGIAEGRAKGIAEGEIKTNRRNAKTMKDKGYAIEDIAEITGLSAEAIASL